MPIRQARGFTLIELMVAVAVVAILAAIALPSYSAYVMRARVPPALDALSAFQVRMEQRFQDVGSYANGVACGVALPANGPYFTFSCDLVAPAGYRATATGTGAMNGYVYTIDDRGARTTRHPKGDNGTCWSTRGGTCDE